MSSNEMKAARSLFRWDDDVIVTRAPGRLDVMGGIADYSGSLVLQLPLREACHVAAQLQPPGRQRVWRHMEEAQRQNGAEAPAIRVVSLYADDTNRAPTFDIYLSELQGADGGPLDYDAARALFRRDPAQSWAAYIVGCLVVLMREKGLPMPASGLSLLVASEVPEGKGVSSSAAVEVSTMMALCQLYGMEVGGRELALLCQKVENAVVGAPCGVMDQMTSALGRAGHLMLLQCQPAEVQGFLPLPPHVAVWGLDSGIRHAVVGTDYGLVRTGAFMGLKIASTTAASSVPPARETNAEKESAGEGGEEEERVRKAPRTTAQLPGTLLGGGYLANVSPSEFSLRYAPLLPREMAGSEFLARFGPHADSSTEVVPEQMYAVLEPAAHPVHENFRVKAFEQVMLAPRSSSQMETLGELMAQAHAAYSRLGLGSEGTDLLCRLAAEHGAQAAAHGRQPELYGAKITGGGSGGTVCLLGARSAAAAAAVEALAEKYCRAAGHRPVVFSESSMGAIEFGHLRIRQISRASGDGSPGR